MDNISQNELDGEVCTMRFYLTNKEGDVEDKLFFHFREIRNDLKQEANSIVQKNLGKQFTIDIFEVSPGSVEILLVITTIGTLAFAGYEAFSKYKNFVESLNLVKAQIKSLFIKEAVGAVPDGVTITNSMRLNPALKGNQEVSQDFETIVFLKKIIWMLLIYILFSHFILLIYGLFKSDLRYYFQP